MNDLLLQTLGDLRAAIDRNTEAISGLHARVVVVEAQAQAATSNQGGGRLGPIAAALMGAVLGVVVPPAVKGLAAWVAPASEQSATVRR